MSPCVSLRSPPRQWFLLGLWSWRYLVTGNVDLFVEHGQLRVERRLHDKLTLEHRDGHQRGVRPEAVHVDGREQRLSLLLLPSTKYSDRMELSFSRPPAALMAAR
jgi:hypothetical protein